MTDVFSRYQDRLEQLTKLFPHDDANYTELLSLGARLQENVNLSRHYGDTETRRADRAQILDSLNQLTLAAIGEAFVEWDKAEVRPAACQEDAKDKPAAEKSGHHVDVQGDVSGQVAVGDKITQSQSTLFDQRGQRVGTQYNVAGEYLSASRPASEPAGTPQLCFTTDVDLSTPTPAEEKAGAKRSWFIRLRIENGGQSRATNCLGRLLGVRDEEGSRLKQLESLELYWTRQDRPDNFRPLDIQGNGDFRYLDVAQVIEAENVLRPRVVVPEGHRLVQSSADVGRPGDLTPGTYYLRVAIYADNDSIKPTWFRITWTDDFSVDPPCRVNVAEPPPESSKHH